MSISAQDFVNELKKTTQLTPNEEAVLVAGGIRSRAALLGVTYAFPSLATKLKLDFPKLSYAATNGLGKSHTSFLAFAQGAYVQRTLPDLGYGAQAPPNSPVPLGTAVPFAVAAAPPAAAGPLGDLRSSILTGRSGW